MLSHKIVETARKHVKVERRNGKDSLSIWLLWAVIACSVSTLASCRQSDPNPRTEQESGTALAPEDNAAASSKGARAIASSSAGQPFPIANLNDGTGAPWGAAEGQDDVYAAVVMSSPQQIREFRIWLFTPNQPPRPHLRDIRVIAADSEESKNPKWRVVRSRLSKDQEFSEKVTIPPLGDGSIVRVEIDSSDTNWGPHKIWGFGCFTASRGDLRNYLTVGTGVYIRELQMK
jgi:hypothetical protein